MHKILFLERSSFTKKPVTHNSVPQSYSGTASAIPSALPKPPADIQEQIRQTQLEINMLSGGMSGIGIQMAGPTIASMPLPYGGLSSTGPFAMGMNMGANVGIGVPQQQPMISQQPMMPQQSMMQMNYGVPGYAAQMNPQMSMQYSSSGAGFQSSAMGGYQPPYMPPAMNATSQQMQYQQGGIQPKSSLQQSQQPGNIQDPFDFLR
jgi:hypothetical protein